MSTANLTGIEAGTQVTVNSGSSKAGSFSTMGELDLNDLSREHTEILFEHDGIGKLGVYNILFSFSPRGNIHCAYLTAARETKRHELCRVAIIF